MALPWQFISVIFTELQYICLAKFSREAMI